jgi:hypothetical protein
MTLLSPNEGVLV